MSPLFFPHCGEAGIRGLETGGERLWCWSYQDRLSWSCRGVSTGKPSWFFIPTLTCTSRVHPGHAMGPGCCSNITCTSITCTSITCSGQPSRALDVGEIRDFLEMAGRGKGLEVRGRASPHSPFTICSSAILWLAVHITSSQPCQDFTLGRVRTPSFPPVPQKPSRATKALPEHRAHPLSNLPHPKHNHVFPPSP